MLIEKYLEVKPIVGGYYAGFDLRKLYKEKPFGKNMGLKRLLGIVEEGAQFPKDLKKKQAVARWMAIQLRKNGIPRGPAKVVGRYKIPPRPFFVRLADQFIKSNPVVGIEYKVTAYKLFIYAR